jgi:hypothetical protein
MANNLCIHCRYGLMGEIDYTMQVEIDNLLQLGVVGASDCSRFFMGVVYDIDGLKMLQVQVEPCSSLYKLLKEREG